MVIAFIELMEAEVRQLRLSIFRLGLALALLVLCTGMALGGVVVLVMAVYFFLAQFMPRAPAALCVALVLLAGSGGILWLAKQQVTK
jgi:hypothetical protein